MVEVWTGPGQVQRALAAGLDVLLAYGWYGQSHTLRAPHVTLFDTLNQVAAILSRRQC